MAGRIQIDFDELISSLWLLGMGRACSLTSGDFQTGQFNSMTIGWGSMGYMWNLPFVQVVVRPVRYTYQFTEKFDTFTVSAFSKEYAPALKLLGTTSGRDGDKMTKSGLVPVASSTISAPGFEQAELILECRKIYWEDMEKNQFLDPRLEEGLPGKRLPSHLLW